MICEKEEKLCKLFNECMHKSLFERVIIKEYSQSHPQITWIDVVDGDQNKTIRDIGQENFDSLTIDKCQKVLVQMDFLLP